MVFSQKKNLLLNLKMPRYFKGKMWKGWWLFRAKDFQSLMYPCFITCYLLGMFPYKINSSTFEASKSRYIVSTVIICVCCVFDSILIYCFIFTINLGSMIRTLEAISFYMLYGFIVIITYITNGPRMRLLRSIWKLSLKLSPETYRKLSRWIHFKDIFATIFLIVQTCVYFFKTQPINVNGLILMAMFTMYLTVVVFQINMTYMNCVCVLKACFRRINEKVAHIQKIMINDIESCVPRLICPIPRNQFLLIKLKILKKQHLMIGDAMKTLNIIFSVQLLSTIVIIISNITFELYFYVVRWQDGLRITFDWQFFDVFLISILFYTIKITLLVWACETGKNQAQELGTIIHEVLNSTSDEEIKNEVIKAQFYAYFSENVLYANTIFYIKISV